MLGKLTFPQSLWLEELADAILDFFLLSFSFSPANTTSLASLRQPGQYLKHARYIDSCITKHNNIQDYIN